MTNTTAVAEVSVDIQAPSAHELVQRFERLHKNIAAVYLMDIPEADRGRFAVWRQSLGGVLVWYKRFAQYKDYSGAINASLALGKFDSGMVFDASVVSQADQEELLELGELMWQSIKANTGRLVPFE